MRYHVLTLFPEMIENGMSESIIGRARQKGLIELNIVNIRDFSTNKHNRVDDYPYGGGAGMVMEAEPVYLAYESVVSGDKASAYSGEDNRSVSSESDRISGVSPRVIYLNPQGKVFNQSMAVELAKEEELIFLCGHYEGIDERVLEEIVTDHISIGDYVLTGGELPAMVLMDAISRNIPGVLSNEESTIAESFSDFLLEYPQYTRPFSWREKEVPEVLLSGHHKNIEKWRREQSLIRTLKERPELLEEAKLSGKEREFVEDYAKNFP